MAEVFWIKGHLNPPESGEYYIILEAMHDMPGHYKKGDVSVETDYFDIEAGEWQSLGKENPSWKVLCWGDILQPNIPKSLLGRVKTYMGEEVDTGCQK